MNIDISQLVEKYPNDQQLGSKVREMYWESRDKQYRELLDLPRATDNNSKSTTVTSVNRDIKQSHTTYNYPTKPSEIQYTTYDSQRFPGRTSKDYTINPENSE